MKKWRTIWFFWAIMALHAAAILIFTRGFLLTRTELPFYSNCSDVNNSPCFADSRQPPRNLNTTAQDQENGQCWTKPAVGRLVILVLDALRFDFVAPSSFFKETKPWMDRLQVLQNRAFTEGSSAKIFKAIADPPTTSLQRLKGLTTGGLPTFVDVGNSFGAPAIAEDNLIHQLVQNGKRVVMMGDDTWVQLFPHHFSKSYPFPSFNVKDLHTVDNGCIENLLPTLHQEDWDVLIAHFLGVDHAGHIFGVDSSPMIEKLDQYNSILEKVIDVLESQSGPGGLHESTVLLVMGDHGQTLNGDHGGGSPEEVETSLFAMSFKKPPVSLPSEINASCEFDPERRFCISSIQQLDFSVTVSALMGIPFPFGSIGRVNPEVFALAAGTWNLEDSNVRNGQYELKSEQWLHNYANVLCVNAWQVKRYIDIYSASSLIGFSSEDLSHIAAMYGEAEQTFLHTESESNRASAVLKRRIDVYSNFLASVAELARSKWTEFNLKLMGIGFTLMIFSVLIHILAIKRMNKLSGVTLGSGNSNISFGLVFASFIVVIRACSLLSNSYVLEEGKVANFLLATTGIAKLRYSIIKKKMLLEAGIFLVVISIMRFSIEVGLSKQAASSAFLHFDPSRMLGIDFGHPIWIYISEFLPTLSLILLAYLLYKTAFRSSSGGIRIVFIGTIISYIFIALHWASESNMLSTSSVIIGKNSIPRIVYAKGFGQLLFLAFVKLFCEEKGINGRRSLVSTAVAMVSVWSSTVIILSGKQGSLVALASIVGGYSIVKLHDTEAHIKGSAGELAVSPLSVTQWYLFAVCLFFCTGHWCAFDGLRYGAAFVGFDEFMLIRQAFLLTIETFGFSHIIPIFGLPFLVSHQDFSPPTEQPPQIRFAKISLVFMIYGLITAATATVTILCVAIQRRHLMVWGLFAPKFVFDVVGLLLSDLLIGFASIYYLGPKDKYSSHFH